MGKFDMDVYELDSGELEKGLLLCMAKKDTGELEYGLLPYMTEEQEQKRGPRWQIGGLADLYKILLALSLLVLSWQCSFSFARPAQSRQVEGVPQYVLDYAPYVYLDSKELFFPSDIGAQVANTHPELNFTDIDGVPSPLTLDNLNVLNAWGDNGTSIYLTINADVTTKPTPAWVVGVVPDSTGKTNDAVSCAIITTDHGNGSVDAFYMYFYAYNWGNVVLGQELGDHIGDWEHNMIRFKDGVPEAVWYSQHGNGEAFTYKVVEKIGLRPISYSAKGSHANYAIAGTHDHTIPDLNLPFGLLLDYTSKGKLWDPTLSTYFYTFDPETSSFGSIDGSPVGAMEFKGAWGDDQYPASDPRQPEPFFGFYKWVGGPTGPQDKQLNRKKVCPDDGILCIVRTILSP